MGPPTTRSRTHSTDSRAVASKSMEGPAIIWKVTGSLANLKDDATVRGRDAKELRDATAEALVEVWNDARSATASLARQVDENNSSLLVGLNESFSAVGEKINSIPMVATLSPDGPISKIVPFTGSGEDANQFSMWLRRLEDVIRMKNSAASSQVKANFLIGHLDGVAREKIEELGPEEREDFNTIVTHLKKFFEGPQHRYMARQTLSVCQQQPGESSSSFANRLLNLVRAATTGQDPASQKERVLEEFVARLRPDIRYYVKLDNPATFEQAVGKAQMVEQLLAEATADRLIAPATAPRSIEIKALSPRPAHQLRLRDQRFRRNYRSPRFNSSSRFQGPNTSRGSGFERRNGIPSQTTCFNCGGCGHLARQCPSPQIRSSGTGKRSFVPSRGGSSQKPNRRPSSVHVMQLSPSDYSTELLEARKQIQSLSISMRDQQQALENSEARVSALMKRNEELASSTFGRPAPISNSSLRSLPELRLLMLCAMLFSTFFACEALPSSAWLCPHEPSDLIARIPMSYNCSRIIPRIKSVPRALTIHVFRPNTRRYDTPASLCKIIKRTVEYSVNFFGARTETHSETYQIVSIDACRLMIQHHKCEFGSMSVSGDSWATTNELVFEWPSAPFGCCTTHTASVSNCYLINTAVHARHGSDFPDSAAGDLHQCKYSSGSCIMQDGSVLMWTPNQEEACQYIPVTKMKGHILSDIWISDSKEFALSWRDDSERITDCGNELTISDQGYGVVTRYRVPRAVKAKVGMVTSNQLAAQLLAVEDTVGTAVSALFHHALSALCDRTNLLALALHTSLAFHPTFTMRNLLDRHDIAASYLGNDLVQVHRCMPIPPKNYKMIPFNGTCFTKPLVEISLGTGTVLHLFIDPATLVVSHDASTTECSAIQHFFFPQHEGYMRFNPFTGEMRVAPNIDTLAIPNGVNASMLALPLTIFHNLVLTNLSELTQDHQLQELWSTVNQDRLLRATKSAPSLSNLQSSPSTVSSLPWVSWLVGSWSIYDVWTTICCIVVSFGIFKSALILYLNIYYPGWLPRFQSFLHTARYPTAHKPETAEGGPSLPTTSAPRPTQDIELAPVAIDATTSWPPRASMSPIYMLATGNANRFFIAQIPIKVNDINILALVDTGAAITITSDTAAPLLGVFRFDQSDIPWAVGMAGVPVRLVGRALLHFEIGSVTMDHPVYFTDSACIPTVANSYNMIMGNDLLSPPWSINYNKKAFHIADQQVNILSNRPETSEERGETIPVRVAKTTYSHHQVRHSSHALRTPRRNQHSF